jgi:hypothetical protein
MIPESFGQLAQLQYLCVFNDTAFPIWLRGFSLTNFTLDRDMSNNNFYGPIPSSFGSLTKLSSLYDSPLTRASTRFSSLTPVSSQAAILEQHERPDSGLFAKPHAALLIVSFRHQMRISRTLIIPQILTLLVLILALRFRLLNDNRLNGTIPDFSTLLGLYQMYEHWDLTDMSL